MNQAEILVTLGDGLWSSNIHSRWPTAKHVYDWMKDPKPGDLVLVTMTGWDTKPENRVGTYDATWSYLHPLPEDAGETEESWPLSSRAEQIFGIVLLDGSYFKWTNVQLIRIPRDHDEWLEAQYDPCPDCGLRGFGHKIDCPQLESHRR